MKRPLPAFVTLLVMWGSGVPASAQTIEDPAPTARFRLGPVSFTPKVALKQLGVDTNVYNVSQAPERDFTAILTTGVDAWLRVGRAYFTSKSAFDWNYFQKASNQRSADFREEAGVEVDLFRVVPRAGGSLINSRQRPNDEIDLRVQQRHTGAYVGVLIPVGARGRIDLETRFKQYDFSHGEFGDASVASALNRESRETAVSAGFDLTPLTRFTLLAEQRADRFDLLPDRNSDSWRVMPGLEFKPDALISGRAFVGYRTFKTPSDLVPEFSGVVSRVELKLLAMDVFRLTGQFTRDVEYSLDPSETFYVSTAGGIELLQAVGLDWDVVGRVRRATLTYQRLALTGDRSDRVWQTGFGIGRRLGTEIRVGIDVDYVTRASTLSTRTYDGWRYGGSVTYGY